MSFTQTLIIFTVVLSIQIGTVIACIHFWLRNDELSREVDQLTRANNKMKLYIVTKDSDGWAKIPARQLVNKAQSTAILTTSEIINAAPEAKAEDPKIVVNHNTSSKTLSSVEIDLGELQTNPAFKI